MIALVVPVGIRPCPDDDDNDVSVAYRTVFPLSKKFDKSTIFAMMNNHNQPKCGFVTGAWTPSEGPECQKN